MYWLLTFLFSYSLFQIFKQLPGQSTNFILWIVIGIHFLIIGRFLPAIFPNFSGQIKRVTIVLMVVSVYFSLGTGLLHYQGEGGESHNLKAGKTVNYGVILHDGLGLPLTIMNVIPLDSKGVELIQTNIQEPEDKETLIKKYFCLYGMEERFGLNMIFKVTKDESHLPRKLIITYRLFHVIPMANIIELRWPQFKLQAFK